MMTEFSIRAVHRGGMRVTAGDHLHQITMDYPFAAEQKAAGLTPLQMLLASLAACSINSVMAVLQRRLNQPVTGLEVDAHALRKHEHPTVLTEIQLDFLVKGAGVDPSALKLSEEQLCPVWNMLKRSTPIRASFRLIEEPVAFAAH
jgi:putative redox protein